MQVESGRRNMMNYVEYESLEVEEIKQSSEAQGLKPVAVLGDRVRLGPTSAGPVDKTLAEVLDIQLAHGSMPA
jgi:hypothetical protein